VAGGGAGTGGSVGATGIPLLSTSAEIGPNTLAIEGMATIMITSAGIAHELATACPGQSRL
jgi:hypothetical protein